MSFDFEALEPELREQGGRIVDRMKKARSVTLTGLVVNLVLTALKYAAGFLGSSAAMIADATHSLSDLLTDAVVFFGLEAASKPPDSSHPYGHGKIEAILAAVCGFSLLLAGGGIFLSGMKNVVAFFSGSALPRPGGIALAAALVSVLSKEIMYRYTIVWGRRLESSALIAKAWDHRSDAFSSIGTLAGISGAYFLGERWSVLDPLAAVIVTYFIARAALPILRDSLDELIEASLPDELEDRLRKAILSVDQVESFHKLKTRRIGSAIAVDVHIQMDGKLSLTEAHDVSRHVEDELWRLFGGETHISLHMEPRSSIRGAESGRTDPTSRTPS